MELNQEIITNLASKLNIKESQITAVLNMLNEGATVPFIARYRKESTGALDEEAIRTINDEFEYQVNLLKKKEDVIRLIDEKGLLTEDLKNNIMASTRLVEVDDLYLPLKKRKKLKRQQQLSLVFHLLRMKCLNAMLSQQEKMLRVSI